MLPVSLLQYKTIVPVGCQITGRFISTLNLSLNFNRQHCKTIKMTSLDMYMYIFFPLQSKVGNVSFSVGPSQDELKKVHQVSLEILQS